MSVTIPSDLVLDVMRNAESLKTAKLGGTRPAIGGISAGSSTMFSNVLNGLQPFPELAAASGLEGIDIDVNRTGADAAGSPRTSYEIAFEQMVLRNMFESILPDADSGIYGEDESSAGIWRSLFADNLATVYAGRSELGIAAPFSRQHHVSGPVGREQWPYFEQQSLDVFPG
jgi:hypothetical protein